MADVVLGIGASHAPNLANPALMRGGKEEQYERVKRGFAQARTLLEQTRPEVIVIFSTDHFDRCFYDNLPPFLVGVGESATGPANEWLKIPRITLRVAGELGRFLVTEGLEKGVDFALSEELPLDHAEIVPLSYLTPAWDIPIVPIVVNAFAPPMPSLQRCLQVGAFVGEAIARWPQSKRVAVVGTGGLSHWVGLPETGRVNAEFDRWFLDCLVERRETEVVEKYRKAEDLEKAAGNGGQEIRDWLAVAAAVPGHLKPRVLAYEPIPGCGIGVMAWATA